MADFNKTMKLIFHYEGGYSNDSFDRGGKTKFGITEAVAREHGYKGDMKDLSSEIAEQIYKKSYWNFLKLDDVKCQIVADEIMDIAVNMGVVTAGMFVQEALNILNCDQKDYEDIEVDGIVGKQTIRTLNKLTEGDIIKAFLKTLNGLQFMKYYWIAKNDKKQERFFIGWLKRINY